MLEILKGLYGSAKDPVLIIKDSEIVYRNPAALQLDKQLCLPDDICAAPAPFVSVILLNKTEYQITASAAEEYKVFVLYEIQNNNKALLTSLGISLKDTITTIQLAANALKNSDNSSNSQQYQNILFHQIHSINRLAGNMLHIGGAGFNPDSGIVDLVELYGTLVHSVNVLTGASKAAVEFSSTVNELIFKCNSTLLEKMMLNLLSNSLKATPVDGKITVNLSRIGNKAIITVKDNGVGIPDNILPHLFSSYDVERELSDRYQSVGLGLSVVQNIAQSMGGSVVIKSSVGKGTTVTVSLPIPEITSDMLYTPLPQYGTREMSLLQTELCDVLTADCYGEIFND